MRVFPVSALPSTPQGKWSAVQEWIEAGFVSRPFAMQLMDFPDLDAVQRIELADLDYVQWQVERMLDGEDVAPEPYQDLNLATDIVRKSLLQADMMGAEDNVLQRLRDYLDECKAMLTPPESPEQTPPNLTALPGGAGGAPPPELPPGPPSGPGLPAMAPAA